MIEMGKIWILGGLAQCLAIWLTGETALVLGFDGSRLNKRVNAWLDILKLANEAVDVLRSNSYEEKENGNCWDAWHVMTEEVKMQFHQEGVTGTQGLIWHAEKYEHLLIGSVIWTGSLVRKM